MSTLLTPLTPRKHKMTRMSGAGDETVAEWDLDVTSEDRLAEIETEFNRYIKLGYFAADLNTNELIQNFDANTDCLLIPRMAGGVR